MRLHLFLLALLLLSLPAPAQESSVRVEFVTWPPGATVLAEVSGQDEVSLGLSGRPVSVRREHLADRNVAFRLAGHQDVVFRVRSLDLAPGPDGTVRVPREGRVDLSPQNPAVAVADFFRYRPVVAFPLLAGLAVAGALGWRARSRTREQLTRAREVEAMQARADDSYPLIGKLMGGYRVVDRLGRGGMATVYRGVREEDGVRQPGSEVAIKVISRDLSEDPEFRARFMRESRVSQFVEHAGIVHVVDSGEQEGLLYLVMELVPGVPLRDLVREGGLPVPEVLDLARPMLTALQAAHDGGIVHRDLKPDNVMVLGPKKVKLMDFGLARSQEFTVLTVSGTALGTPAYMAPEQIQAGSIDARVDQYAAGVVLYELLTGRRPFESGDAMALLFSHLSEDPPSPREFRPDLAEDVAAVLLRMIAREPEDRFGSVREALQALERAAS